MMMHATAAEPRTALWADMADADIATAVQTDSPTGPEVLAALANHPDPLVRWKVAQHPNTTADTLDRLSRQPESRVLAAVAENPRARFETVERIAYGHDEFASRSACQFSIWARNGHEF